MNPRTTGLLLVAALALGGFIYFYEIRGAEDRADADAASKRIFPEVEAEEIESLRFTSEDGIAVEIERRGDGWRIANPVDFPADDVTVEGMVSALAQFSRDTEVHDPASPEVYGLSDEGDAVHFRADGADYGLRLGIETPVGANAYVAAVGQERESVGIVAAWRVNSFRREMKVLRDARIAHFDRTALRGLRLSWPEGGVALRREGVADDGSGGEWRLVEPVEAEADEKLIDNLLSDLSFLRADGFVDARVSDVDAGLAEPALSIALILANDEGNEVMRSFEIGDVYEEDDRLVRGAERSLYRISKERLDDFPRSVFEYRFKELSNFDVSSANRVQLVYQSAGPGGGDQIVLEESEGIWRSDRGSVSQEAVSRFIDELAHLEADSIIADAMGSTERAGLGLEPARLQISVVAVPRSGGNEEESGEGSEGGPVALAEVLLGDVDADFGIAARSGERALIYRVALERIEPFPMSIERFDRDFLAPEPIEDEPGDSASSELDELDAIDPIDEFDEPEDAAESADPELGGNADPELDEARAGE